MSSIEQHKKELTRIANIEDYDEEEQAIEDAGYLLTIACAFEKEIDRLTKERHDYKRAAIMAEERLIDVTEGILKLIEESS